MNDAPSFDEVGPDDPDGEYDWAEEPPSVFRVLLLGGSERDQAVVENAGDAVIDPIAEVFAARLGSSWAHEVRRTRPDVVVIRVDALGEDPLRRVKRFFKSEPTLPVVVLARADQPELRLEALTAGAQDFYVRDDVELDPRGFIRALRHASIRHRRTVTLDGLARRYAHDLQRLKQHTDVDPLTGYANARGLERALMREANRTSRGHDDAALVIEIDDWPVHEQQLARREAETGARTAAEAVRLGLRDMDLLARIKGPRFVALLTGTGRTGAIAAANRVRDHVRAAPIRIGEGRSFSVTGSVAILELGPEDRSVSRLVERAEPILERIRASCCLWRSTIGS